MKLKKEIRILSDVVRSYRYVMFPTLTRPMVGVAAMAGEIAGNDPVLGDEFLSRVQRAYRAAIADYRVNDGSMWSEIEHGNAAFIAALESDRPEDLRSYSQNLFAGRLMTGMAHIQSFVTGRKTLYPKPYFALRIRDGILSLAEALAINGLPSNQQTAWPDYVAYLNQDLAGTITEIEARLGYAIEAPAVGCPPVCRIAGRPFNPDFIRHAYMMHRVRQLGFAADDPILEIGGGYGCVARFAFLSGFRDYTIIDLPYVNAIQMLFLGAAIGVENVSGFGEAPARVRLVPSHRKDLVAEGTYGLAINMDSLPEMARDEAVDYLGIVAAKARNFLSINQEAQKVHGAKGGQLFVNRLIRDMGSMRLLHRHKYWMEQGYTEEYYSAAPLS